MSETIFNLLDHLMSNHYHYQFVISGDDGSHRSLVRRADELDEVTKDEQATLLVWRGEKLAKTQYSAVYHSVKGYSPLTKIKVYLNNDKQILDVDAFIRNDSVAQLTLF